MTDWTRAEVEATVADYLGMLEAERRGEPFNKAEHNRNLREVLSGRTKGAVELKHENISAVLIELGYPYVEGYKPLGNYQRLLHEVVAEQVQRSASLLRVLATDALREAQIPTIDDILRAHVTPPRPRPGLKPSYPARVRQRPLAQAPVNYLAIEAGNRSLGAAGEAWVERFEQARLLSLRRDDLAKRVERVSTTKGDGLGYDILSFDKSGADRLIEVKTTTYGEYTPFFVTRNELAVSREQIDRYHLYRVFAFRRKPRVFWKRGQLDHEFGLDPEVYRARIA